jgi:hypothetical protein
MRAIVIAVLAVAAVASVSAVVQAQKSQHVALLVTAPVPAVNVS